MAEKINLICTVEELTDYAGATRTFAANISAGMSGNSAPATLLSKALLQPWLWALQSVSLYCQTDLSNPALNKPVTATLMANPPLEPGALKALTTRLANEFAATLAATSQSSPLFNWDPTNPGGSTAPVLADSSDPQSKQQHPWPNVLAHASTFPAPVPHLLNLVVFFEVKATDLSGVLNMLVAPVFSVTTTDNSVTPPVTFTASYLAPTATPVPPPTLPAPAPGAPPAPPEQGYIWSYVPAAGDASGCLIDLHQPGLTIGQAVVATPVPGTINPNSPWLLPQYEDSNEDWRSTLELRIAESFDLARQIISTLRDAYPDATQPTGYTVPTEVDIFGAAATAAQLDQLRTTVLYLLRDNADFGLRYAPDGANCLRYVLERVASDPNVQMPPSVDVDSFVGIAEQALSRQEAANLNAMPPRDWLTDLASVLGADALVLKIVSPSTNSQPSISFPVLLTSLSDTQKLLAQDATIAALLYSQWNRVLAADAQASVIWKTTLPNSATTVAALVQTELNTLAAASGLRKRMLLGNLGGSNATLIVWNALIATSASTLDERPQIADNLACVLLASFYSRFGITPPPVDNGSFGRTTLPALDYVSRTPSVAPPQPVLPAPLQTFLGQQLTASALAAKTILVTDGTAAQPSPTAQPAVLRLHTTAQAAAAKDDPLRGIAGACILLREFRAATLPQLPWSCLNVGALDILDATGTPIEAEAVAFVPHRLTTRNGISQTAISYDNRPLAAPSPSTALSKYFSPDSDTPYFPLFAYRSVPQTPNRSDSTKLDSWAHISGLKYGATYQALGFLIRNSGALPKELADPNPTFIPPNTTGLPVAPLIPLAPAIFTAPALAIPTFTYKRRTPVGPLRIKIGQQEKDFNQQSLPLIPDTVAPLAREAYLATTGTESSVQIPLLMLWDSAFPLRTQSYQFTVRPPSVDVNVWDRWVAARSDAANFATTRAAVLTDFHLLAPKSLTDPSLNATKTEDGADVSINDPAIIGYVCTLIPLYAPSAAKPGAPANTPQFAPLTDLVPVASAAFTEFGVGFAAVQGKQYNVTIAKATQQVDPITHLPLPGPFASLEVNAMSITVNVPAGEVWQLSIAPAINFTDAGKFDIVATSDQFPSPASSATTPVQLPSATPFELLIEYAQPASITPQELWQSMHFDFADGLSASGLTLDLAPAAGDDWHLIRRVEVSRQAWRWMGRPIYLPQQFPSSTLGDLNGVVIDANDNVGRTDALDRSLNWELQGFAERDDDSTLTESRVFFPTPPAAPAPQHIYRQDLTTDLRAHYFRFGARIYSRYEGLNGFQPFIDSITKSQSVVAEIKFSSPPPNGSKADGYTTSSRYFVPCRIPRDTTLPKPKILLVLPLTAPVDNGAEPHTSILVIADEPWYQIGGLAEQLTASVEAVVLQRETDQLQMLQFGPDPILAAPNPQIPAPTPNTNPPALAPWIGTPIGTTFDDASTAPLLANTCFQFPLSQLATTSGTPLAEPLDWYMAKLQFSRSINPTMSMNANVSSSPLTDGVWVQFLPSSSHFTDSVSKSPIPVADLTFTWSAGQQVEFVDYDTDSNDSTAQPVNVTLQPGPARAGQPTSPVNLQLWALLMRDITDAAGQPGEAYVGLCNLTTGTQPTNPIGTPDHLYLLEVQSTPNISTQQNGWLGQIFPGSDTTVATTPPPTGEPDATIDVTHRVLRISDRINVSRT